MNTVIKEALDKEILDDVKRLGDVNPDSEEFKKMVDSLVKLMDKAIEIEKHESERAEKEKDRNLEAEFKRKQLEEQRKSRESDDAYKKAQLANERKGRLISNIITIASMVVTTVVTVWGTNKSLKFEETGTYTSLAGRSYANRTLKN